MNAGDKLLNVAKADVGYSSSSTHSKFNTWYGMNGYWCAMALSYWASVAGILGTVVPKHAYTPSGANWYKQKGRWHNGASGLKRGDSVYFSFGGKRIDHVGIFVGWNRGRIVTLDGNTGSVNGRSGGQVKYATRSPRYVVGYGSNQISLPDPKPAVKPAAKPALKPPAADVKSLALRVWAGEFGDGATRRAKLGAQYDAVQARVTYLYRLARDSSTSELVRLTKLGVFGNDPARSAILGNRRNEVQRIINRR
ncbi:hypothetical protein [Boudabousia marimammalium]|uniref:Cpl-7 lysozyme C-terminal domain-containing protein n=1 Tax=Boudabousia marimammalium TaxID=156892 RepID=A0A1Q5PNY4_9ACTO|nr:hypothetical protein [Boudabousia marimammalium]OKL49291.1 hypothetical protein BM477_04730 [Boudabousia marimammalium]